MTGRRAARRPRKPSRNAPASGNPDANVLFAIKKFLAKTYRIQFQRILIEHAIRITSKGCVMLGRLSYHDIAFVRGIVRTPDITVVDGEGSPVLVIEQDGRVHDSAEMAKKDAARNACYVWAGIPCIVLNTQKIRSTNMTTAEYLTGEMAKIQNLDFGD